MLKLLGPIGFILDALLPLPPWKGPPLPKFLNIRWPKGR